MHVDIRSILRALAVGTAFIILVNLAPAAELPPPVPPRKPPVPALLARPIAGAMPITYAKGAAILDVDGLKIVNTGEVDTEGKVLLTVSFWQREKGGALVRTVDDERWILGHLHIIQVYTGRVFNTIVHGRKEDGSVLASYTSRGPENQKKMVGTKHKKPLKAAQTR